MDILFLCTGNVCRSPVAEALLRSRLAERGIEARVHSAGLIGGGRPADPYSVEVLTPRGLDLAPHRSRQMTRDLLTGADLVLGMAREHVREAAVVAPEVWPRTYTVKELVRRAAKVGPRKEGEPLDAWLARVHEGRSPRDLAGWSTEDDVADPLGESRPVFEQLAVELDALLERVVDLAWPSPSSRARWAQEQWAGR